MITKILLQVQDAAVLQPTQKIEVVIGVIALVFVGIVAYMISVERRLKKLENKKS